MSTLRATNIKGRSSGISPAMPDGVVVTGVTTSTTFSGNVTGVAATFSGNVSIADSIIHTGDTDTSIRFPSAGTFTVSTNGSEAIRVDSSQRFFVNQTSNVGSTAKLEVTGTLDNTYPQYSYPIMSVDDAAYDSSSGPGGGIGFAFKYNTSGNYGQAGGIRGFKENTTDGNYASAMSFYTRPHGSAPTEKLRITSTGGFHFNNGELIERAKVTAGKLSDNANIDLENGMVHLFTTAESTTSTPNLRINSSTSVNSVMAIGDTIAVTIITTAAAAGYSAQLTIDGSAVTENWVGGSAPSSGGSSGVDIYNYTIIKTADATFTVVANYTATS